MPKQIWIHNTKRTLVIRHSNADVILKDGEYADFPIAPFVVIESVGMDGLLAIYSDVFFKEYTRVAIQHTDTIDDFINEEKEKNEFTRQDISN